MLILNSRNFILFNKRWLFFVPIIFAIIVVVLLKQNSKTPQQTPEKETIKAVRVLPIPQLAVTPIAIGYGTVYPASTWEAIAQVEGVVLKKNLELAKGKIVKKGTLLLQIDPVDYELTISQIEADILATQAQLKELDIKQENTKASLAIEKKSLALSKNELKRLKKLLTNRSVSHSAFEAQERSMLAQQQSVLSQSNSLKLIPSQKALLDAQLQQKNSQLIQAQRDLRNTKIIMPFTGRISADLVETSQYVRVANTLVSADALDKVEIEVQIPISYFRGLIQPGKKINLLDHSSKEHKNMLGIKAQVVLKEGNLSTSWDARFSRITDTLDPKTRTIGVIVEVDKPYGSVMLGSKPPLVKGFFVEVHLQGNVRSDSLVVPRSALHNQHIYLVDKQNRLAIKKIRVELFQPEFAIIKSNTEEPISAGDKLIISDLVPAIKGMLLAPKEDKESTQHLLDLIKGVQ